jgi:hypothetical protein
MIDTYNVTVNDIGSGTQKSRDFALDPATNAGLFPGGSCTLP